VGLATKKQIIILNILFFFEQKRTDTNEVVQDITGRGIVSTVQKLGFWHLLESFLLDKE